jgi:hypothetical protein
VEIKTNEVLDYNVLIMKVDLHNHSYYSDGVFSPSEVVRFADEAGCELFALTDHDTTDGLSEARQMADKLSVDLVSGVEISAFWRNMTIHIIGLDIDINSDILQAGLVHNQQLRKERAEKIAFGLWRVGIKDALEKTQALSKTDMLTRTHFAQMLIGEGYCKDMRSVFRRYLTGKKPGGIRVEWKNIDEVVGWIHLYFSIPLEYHPVFFLSNNVVFDWDGRWLIHFFPCFIVLSSVGIHKLVKSIYNCYLC